MAEAVPIPEPPGLPFIGNLGEFQTSPIKDLTRLADTYGMHPHINYQFRLLHRSALLTQITRLHLQITPGLEDRRLPQHI